MTFLEQLNTLKRIDALIQLKATGNADTLAKRLSISRASVYRHIDTLKGLNAPIAYCKQHRSFYYKKDYVLKF